MPKSNKHRICIHHSASPFNTSVEMINTWHKGRGFLYSKTFDSYVGYHFVILPNGKIEQTKLLTEEACAVKGHNKNCIHICVIGNFEEDYPTAFQVISLIYLTNYLNRVYMEKLTVVGHKDLTSTLCPGKYLYQYINILN